MKSEQPEPTTPTFEQLLLAALDAASGNASEVVGRIYLNVTSNRPDPQLLAGYEHWRRNPETGELRYSQAFGFERGAMFNFITRLAELRKMPPVADQVAERIKVEDGIRENARYWQELEARVQNAAVK